MARKNVWNVTGSSGFLSMIYEVDLDLQKDPRDALRQRSPPNGMRSHALKSQECHEFYRKAFIGMQSTNLYFE